MRISALAIHHIMRLLRLLSGILISGIIVAIFVLSVGYWVTDYIENLFNTEPATKTQQEQSESDPWEEDFQIDTIQTGYSI